MVKRVENRPLPMFDSDIARLFHKAIEELKKRNRKIPEKNSIRRLAKQCGISHPSLMRFFDNPSCTASRKVMVKVITKTFPRKRSFVKKQTERGTVGLWCPDAI